MRKLDYKAKQVLLRLDEALIIEIEQYAKEEGRTFTDEIRDMLKWQLIHKRKYYAKHTKEKAASTQPPCVPDEENIIYEWQKINNLEDWDDYINENRNHIIKMMNEHGKEWEEFMKKGEYFKNIRELQKTIAIAKTGWLDDDSDKPF